MLVETVLISNKYLHMATHIDTNTWKMDWKTSYLKYLYRKFKYSPGNNLL